uniref:Folliculin n=1 Tax=Cyprinus carpio TaxID=7962 RepID=A0A8C2G9S4_CYPCA
CQYSIAMSCFCYFAGSTRRRYSCTQLIKIRILCFVSVDSEMGIRYLSHQHPRQSQLFSVVRQACGRSLSCAVCKRLLVAMDRIYLINSWPFLLRHLRLTIQSLQNTALEVLDCSTTLVLLPAGCVRAVSYSPHYEEAYRCNFLGLSPDVPIPAHVNASEFSMLVDVLNVERGCKNPISDDDILSLHEIFLNVPFSWFVFLSGPSLLSKIEVALSNENLSVEVVSLCLLCLKVKVLFKFSKVEGRGKEDTLKVLALLGATGPREEDDVHRLKFWMTRLSKLYKSHLMTAVRVGERTLSQ